MANTTNSVVLSIEILQHSDDKSSLTWAEGSQKHEDSWIILSECREEANFSSKSIIFLTVWYLVTVRWKGKGRRGEEKGKEE